MRLWTVEELQGADGKEEVHILPLKNEQVEAGHERSWYCPCRPQWSQDGGYRIVQHRRIK